MLDGQPGDRLGRPVEALRLGQDPPRPGWQLLQQGRHLQPGIAQRILADAAAVIRQRGQHGRAVIRRGVERGAPGPQGAQLLQVLQRDAQGVSQLAVRGLPPDLRPKALLEPADPGQPLSIDAGHRDRVACPFDRPAHRLADPPVGEGREAVPLHRVEPLDRSGQAQVPLLDEVQQLQR